VAAGFGHELNSSAGEKDARAPRRRRRFISVMQLEAVAVQEKPLSACEWALIRTFLRRTHRDDLRRRFGHPFDVDDEVTARRLFDVRAGSGEISWVLDPSGAIAGVAHRVMISPAAAEIAVLVRSDCQRRGIGEFLIRSLVRRAAQQRLRALHAVVQRDNRGVLRLAAKFPYQCRTGTALTVELILDVAGPMAARVG
jgi:GNAT superfamily N-acetyltransferase